MPGPRNEPAHLEPRRPAPGLQCHARRREPVARIVGELAPPEELDQGLQPPRAQAGVGHHRLHEDLAAVGDERSELVEAQQRVAKVMQAEADDEVEPLREQVRQLVERSADEIDPRAEQLADRVDAEEIWRSGVGGDDVGATAFELERDPAVGRADVECETATEILRHAGTLEKLGDVGAAWRPHAGGELEPLMPDEGRRLDERRGVHRREVTFAAVKTAGAADLNPWLGARLVELGAGRRILDVGCGRGFWLAVMASEGLDAFGIEPSKADVTVAARHGVVLRGDAHDLPLARASVDLVWSIHVLHHLQDPVVALGELRRILVPGGRLLLAETVDDNPFIRSARTLQLRWDRLDVESRFRAAELHAMVAEAGFEVIEDRQHSIVALASWLLPFRQRRAWLRALALESRLLPRLNLRWGAHVELVATSPAG